MIVLALPAYNEELSIGSVILKAKEYVDEVIVVDDGSTDSTVKISDLAGAITVSHGKNLGKGAAINTAFREARKLDAKALVLMDADGQHDPKDIPTVVEPVLTEEVDIVVGSRFMDVKSKIPLYRRTGQHILTLATNLASRTKLSDSQSGFRAFSRKAIDTLKFEVNGMGVESEMQFSGLKIMEVPIDVSYEMDGSTHPPLNHAIQVLTSIVRLVSQQRPLTFFGVPGVLVLIAGVVTGARVVYIYNSANDLAIGYGMITVLFVLVGTFAVFTGIILHTVSNLLSRARNE